jgi:PST family polysaccharide transporter
VASVQGAKLCLSTGSVAAAIVALFAVPIFRDHPGYLALALVTAIAQGFDPTWYFTGVERLRLVSAIGVANRVVATVLTIVLVRGRGDGWIVLALWAAGTAIVTVTNTALMYRRLRWRAPARGDVRWALGESWRLFVAGTAVTLYTSANAFLLGVLSTAAQAAFFSTAEKLVRAAPRAFSPITTAVYPRIGHLVARGDEERAAHLSKLTLLLLAAVSTGISLVLLLGAEPIVRVLYGDGFEASVEVLRILALILPMLAISGGLSSLQLLTHQRDRDVVLIVLGSGLLNLGLALVLAPAHGAVGMAWGLVAVEGLALAGTLLAVMLPRRGGARAVGGRPA